MNEQEFINEYLPLVKLISSQMVATLPSTILDKSELEQFGWEGALKALQTYDPQKSLLSLRQWVGWGIKNSIRTALTEYSRTIKMSYYFQKKAQKDGMTTCITQSIDRFEVDGQVENVKTDRLEAISEKQSFDIEDSDPVGTLVNWIKERYDEENIDIFCSVYGIGDYKKMKSKDIAAKYGISNASITWRIKKMINHIKQDPDLLETLSKLL